MKTIHLIIFLFFSLTSIMLGQGAYEIEGRLYNQETNEPIPFANIYNKHLDKGTLSNSNGYFRLLVGGTSDSIQITYVGFKDQSIDLKKNVKFYVVYLEENTHLLGEVTVTPKDDFYLHELVSKCRKSASKIEVESKAHFELKTFTYGEQIELVEGYYNAEIKGYKLVGLHLKNGRIALQPTNNRLFLSVESSRAIIMLNLLKGSRHFPENPLELSLSKMKKNYYLSLVNKYLDGASDSIYIIDYKPKDTTGLFFEGRLWINKTKKYLLQVTLSCKKAKKHPFIPLIGVDSMLNVRFDITQSYKIIKGQAVFNRIDFVYHVDYISNFNWGKRPTYSVTTKAVLHSYDYEDRFLLPNFDYNNIELTDYRKFSALPYNSFFWDFNDENRLNDSLNSNDHFFSDSFSLTSKKLFRIGLFSGVYAFYEYPFVHWSKSRLIFKEKILDEPIKGFSMKFNSEMYNLSVKLFLDANTYKDSTNILTATIFDPFDSYYYLPMDKYTHCFVNIYFDLHEIKRRELVELLFAERNNTERIKEIYTLFIKELEISMGEYLDDVKRGTNLAEMIKYNEEVKRELGVDNIGFFRLFEE